MNAQHAMSVRVLFCPVRRAVFNIRQFFSAVRALVTPQEREQGTETGKFLI
jgi:hypothetical protein